MELPNYHCCYVTGFETRANLLEFSALVITVKTNMILIKGTGVAASHDLSSHGFASRLGLLSNQTLRLLYFLLNIRKKMQVYKIPAKIISKSRRRCLHLIVLRLVLNV